MIKRIIILLLFIVTLAGCTKLDGTPIDLVTKVIIVKEHKDPFGRLITWPYGADIENDEPTLIYYIKDFNYEEGYRYTVPVRIKVENGQESYSYFEWDNHKLTKQRILDGGARK